MTTRKRALHVVLGVVVASSLSIPTPPPLLSAIVLTQTSAATVNPLEWSEDFTGFQIWDGVSSGDKHLMRWRRVNGGAWTTEVEQGLDEEMLTGGFTWPLWEATKSGGALPSGYVEVQLQRARYAAGVELGRSAWSNALVDNLAAPVIWNPTSYFTGGVDGAYWDASDISTLFQDTAGTTPVTASGQSVARINDKSGNGFHLLQATAGKRPIYRTNGGAGGTAPYLDFDGVDDYMQSSSFTAKAQPHYMAIAAKETSVGGGSIQFFFDGIAAGNRAGFFDNNATYNLSGGSPIGASLASDTSDDSLAGLLNGAASVLYKNGVAGSTVDAGSNTLTGITLAATYLFGVPLHGRIYRAFWAPASPNSTLRTNINSWLATGYA